MQGTLHIKELGEMSEFMCINDRIEPLYSHSKSAAAATQVAFQQPARQTSNFAKNVSSSLRLSVLRLTSPSQVKP